MCGDCSACCEVLGVNAIAKPQWTRCDAQCWSGCAVYQDRPAGCRAYECWFLEGLIETRPDQLGLIVDSGKTQTTIDTDKELVNVREIVGGASRTAHGKKAIEELTRHHSVVVHLYGGGCNVLDLELRHELSGRPGRLRNGH